jgi:tetratricopeptide (TPR) repeat protein
VLNPQLPDVRTQLGYAYLFKGRRQEATTLFEGEMALNSEDMNAAAFLGWLYRQDGRLEDAERLLEKARLLRPLDPDVLFQLGLLAQSKKQYEEAIVFFNRVAAVNPDHAPAHIVLVRVYSRLKRTDDMKREQAIVDRLNAEQKNQPTVKQKVLYEVITKPLEQRD